MTIKPPSITELTWAPAAAFAATIGVAVGILLGVIGGLLSWPWQVAVVGGVATFIIAFLDMSGLFVRTAVRVMTMTIEALPMVEPLRPERSITRIEANLLAPGGEIIEGSFRGIPA